MKKKRGTIIVRLVEKPPRLSEHHRKPSSLGGGGEENIQIMTEVKHRAWHSLFENMTPEEIANEINRYYLDLDYCMVVHHVKI